MATTDRNTAVGVFTDFTHAEQAIEALRSAGFPSDRIGFIADEPEKVETPAVEHGTQAGKGAVVGAALGVAVGLAVAAVVLPVAGPVIVGGLLAGVLGGAVTGGTSGGILGALIGLNVPEEEARHCEQQFHSGRCPGDGPCRRPLRGGGRHPAPRGGTTGPPSHPAPDVRSVGRKRPCGRRRRRLRPTAVSMASERRQEYRCRWAAPIGFSTGGLSSANIAAPLRVLLKRPSNTELRLDCNRQVCNRDTP